MPPKTGLEKTRKAIVKKKGQIDAIHEFSRDSKRLHRAAARDDKLVKIASARRKADRPYRSFTPTNSSPWSHSVYSAHPSDHKTNCYHTVERVAFFQEAVKQNDLKTLEASVVQELVKT